MNPEFLRYNFRERNGTTKFLEELEILKGCNDIADAVQGSITAVEHLVSRLPAEGEVWEDPLTAELNAAAVKWEKDHSAPKFSSKHPALLAYKGDPLAPDSTIEVDGKQLNREQVKDNLLHMYTAKYLMEQSLRLIDEYKLDTEDNESLPAFLRDLEVLGNSTPPDQEQQTLLNVKDQVAYNHVKLSEMGGFGEWGGMVIYLASEKTAWANLRNFFAHSYHDVMLIEVDKAMYRSQPFSTIRGWYTHSLPQLDGRIKRLDETAKDDSKWTPRKLTAEESWEVIKAWHAKHPEHTLIPAPMHRYSLRRKAYPSTPRIVTAEESWEVIKAWHAKHPEHTLIPAPVHRYSLRRKAYPSTPRDEEGGK